MMKKIMVLLALALALGGIFAACELDTALRVTVKFVDPSGENRNIPDALIEKGTALGDKLPALAPRLGVVLYGWYDGATRYDADTIVSADVTLTARWSDDVATVIFAFTQTDNTGNIIQPTAEIPSIKAIKGLPLSPRDFPVTPRTRGWVFVAWLLDRKAFTQDTPVPGDITLEALWVNQSNPVYPPDVEIPDDFVKPTAAEYTVTFNTVGGGTVAPLKVYANECIDEWEVRFPADPTYNSINPEAFFVGWFDDENREYDGRTPIIRTLTIKAKWGLPPFIVDLRMTSDGGHVASLEAPEMGVQGSNNYGTGPAYSPVVRKAWDSPDIYPDDNPSADPKWVIVNANTYQVPNNPNRWRILYRIGFEMPSGFDTEFYSRYTIRARFYANRQGAVTWTEAGDILWTEGSFIPNKPAAEWGYKEKGWLTSKNYGATENPDPSRSEDGWGQISWTLAANWSGEGAHAETMLQRYNLDRKGGTINDTWAPLRGTDLRFPPYLLVQTSDNYIGHIEITQIVFHNGEWVHTAYEGEEPPPPPEEP